MFDAAAAIEVTPDNRTSRIDTVERGKGGPRKVIDNVSVRWQKNEAMSQPCAVTVTTHDVRNSEALTRGGRLGTEVSASDYKAGAPILNIRGSFR